jgi:hypothetical protein
MAPPLGKTDAGVCESHDALQSRELAQTPLLAACCSGRANAWDDNPCVELGMKFIAIFQNQL